MAYLFWKALTVLALTVLPAVVLYRDWKAHDKRTRTHQNVTKAILVVWSLAGLSSIALMWFDAKSAKEQLDWATGGSAIPVIIGETPYSDNTKLLVFKVINSSDFPAYNVKIRMISGNDLAIKIPKLIDFPNNANLPEGTIPLTAALDKLYQGETFNIGTLNPHQDVEFRRIDGSEIEVKWNDADYLFFFQVTALNGGAVQTMTWTWNAGKLVNKSTINSDVRNESFTTETRTSSPNFPEKAKWDRGPTKVSSPPPEPPMKPPDLPP